MSRGNVIDEVGKEYGRLIVTQRGAKQKTGVFWQCSCSCGGWTVVAAKKLKNGHTKSCGCLKREHSRRQIRKLHEINRLSAEEIHKRITEPRKCNACKEIKPSAEFSRIKGHICNPCVVKRDQRFKFADPKSYSRKVRAGNLRKKYGLTLEDFAAMEEKQDGRCAICKTNDPSPYPFLAIDHDHNTGRLRGLLCNSCNRALGLFKENKEILRSAIDYLTSRQ